MSAFRILFEYHEVFLQGLLNTLRLCVVAWALGILAGSALGVAAARLPLSIGIPARAFAMITAAVPIIVVLFYAHYPLQAMFGVVIDPFYTACAVLTIINIFAIAEMVRNAILEFPGQYLTAAKVCGLSPRTTLLRIQLPLLLRELIPTVLVQQVVILQASLLTSLIGVEEVFRIAQRVNAAIYQPIPVYTSLAVLLLAVCLPLNWAAEWMRKRFTRNLSER